MNKTFKIIVLLLVSILCFSSFVFAAETSDENQVIVEKKFEVVDKTKCIIDFGEYGHFEKYLASYDENSVTLQLDVTNKAKDSEKKIPSEIFFVLDNSISLRVKVTETETRKDLIYNSAKVLASELFEADNTFKMGVINFSSSEDPLKEGTIADATLSQELTSNNELVLDAIENIRNASLGSRTNIEAGLELARQNFSTNNSKKYIILLTDGVPDNDLHGNTLQYSDIVMTNTKNKLLELDEAGINVISVLTDIDTTAADRDDGRTFAKLAEDVFGTTENPTVGIYYFTTSNSLKNIVEKNVFNDIEIIPGTKLTNIVIKDYFPQEIIDNFNFTIISPPEIGSVTPDVSEETTNTTVHDENAIKIRHAYDYYILSADALNELENEKTGKDFIHILEIYPEGENLSKITELIENSSFEKADLSAYELTNEGIGVLGIFELTIDNNTTLLMDETWSLYTTANDSYIIHTPKDLFHEISTIVNENSKKTNSITWTIPSLDAGEKASLQYKLTLKNNYSKDIVDEILPTNRKVDITDDQGDDETSTDSPKVRVTEKVTPIPKPEPEPEPEPTPEPKSEPEPKPDNTVIPAPKLPQTGTNSFVIASIILFVIGISIFEYIKYNKYNIK